MRYYMHCQSQEESVSMKSLLSVACMFDTPANGIRSNTVLTTIEDAVGNMEGMEAYMVHQHGAMYGTIDENESSDLSDVDDESSDSSESLDVSDFSDDEAFDVMDEGVFNADLQDEDHLQLSRLVHKSIRARLQRYCLDTFNTTGANKELFRPVLEWLHGESCKAQIAKIEPDWQLEDVDTENKTLQKFHTESFCANVAQLTSSRCTVDQDAVDMVIKEHAMKGTSREIILPKIGF